MVSLDDLPRYRRAQLLWRWSHHGVDRVQQMVREAEGRPCRMPAAPKVPPGPLAAVPGDDGRLHLARAGHMLCAEGETDDGWEHQAYVAWVDRGAGPEDWTGGPYAPLEHEGRSFIHHWTVRSLGPAQDPGAVGRAERCRSGGPHWPPPPARTRPIRLLREALVTAFGPDCQLCGLYPGEMVDHDHETGYVRGLLCRFCNCTVDECPHIANCPNADFLRHPPAFALELIYPANQEWRPRESTRRRKIEQLGFDPFEGLHRTLCQGGGPS
ncbi:endonuclease domain-containing protein [Streptomyces sp. NPDC087297]|uniref:endonuclease domain-containing protein n=1 Tax=Streptomyces sp. NPDC087297 TaxID=3365778 RepID=UPI00381C2448